LFILLLQELAAEWTKREKLDFYRTLVTHGVPIVQKANNGLDTSEPEYNWEVIKEKANLKRKTTELIERYYVEFLTQCRNMIEAHHEKNKKAKREDDDLSPDNGESAASQPESKDDITFGQCKRVVQRIMMFSNIRTRVLNSENLDKLLKRAHGSHIMPAWWSSGTHDKALLLVIGFNVFLIYCFIC
jgi:predicted ATP-dependent protease